MNDLYKEAKGAIDGITEAMRELAKQLNPFMDSVAELIEQYNDANKPPQGRDAFRDYVEKKQKMNTAVMITGYEHMLISALRYALGRRTYVVEHNCEYIEQQIPMLSDRCKDVMIKDIENQRNYGGECDKEDWMQLLEKLREQNQH